ncbi:FAD-dependent oxidoreductase, partial [Oleiphilus sp. HI0123]|uniref:FAD-dependent oxidoreductase n=1 Tax=Oleiphilus sp. HI0123 TaxID=1822265 RepID=UPI0007C2C822
MSSYDFDLFVIGAGSGGVRLARMSASMGATVAVAEDRYLGGTCVNVGCVPKKLFVYASHVHEELEDGKGYGWHLNGDLSFNWQTLVKNKNTEIERLNGIYDSLLTNSGAKIINGRARIVDAHTVEVAGQQYSAERIVVATGSWPFIPNIPGAEYAISSNELFYLDNLPDTATVVGGGYIAVEMAGILQGLGVDTTLVYRGELFLRGFDQEVREFVRDEISKKGIRLRFNENIDSISKLDNGSLNLQLKSGATESTGLVLYATGRKPYSYDLGIENTKVALDDKGQIKVNDYFQTSEPSIYAIGDVIGGMQLTPVALAEGMFLANYYFSSTKPSLVDYSLIPTAVFCQPNIATVGLSEEQAREEFDD